MIEWVRALSPIIVAVIPIIAAIVKSSSNTRTAIEAVQKKLDDHITSDEYEKQKLRRIRILQFADEVSKGAEFSNEYWIEIIDTIDDYKKFCKENPNFVNSRGAVAMEYLHEQYLIRLKKGSTKN